MRRRKYQFDERKVQRYLAAGRGAGDGELYEPWLKVYDLPSRGRSHRIFGIKTGRIHHLLSDGEWKCFLRFEADQTVCDIREQFPLDRHQTYQVARDLGIRHPTTCDGTPYVLTLDFLITRLVNESLQLEGYSFKYQPHTLTPRQQELHRITEECLRRNSVPFRVLDESSFNDYFIKNYDSVRSCFDLTNQSGFDIEGVRTIAHAFVKRVGRENRTVLDVCREIAASCTAFSAQDVFNVIKHLIAHNLLGADLDRVPELTLLRMADLRLDPRVALLQ